MSQSQLGARAEIHWTYIGGIERGERNPTLENINKLAAALDTSIGDLFKPFTARYQTRARRPRTSKSTR